MIGTNDKTADDCLRDVDARVCVYCAVAVCVDEVRACVCVACGVCMHRGCVVPSLLNDELRHLVPVFDPDVDRSPVWTCVGCRVLPAGAVCVSGGGAPVHGSAASGLDGVLFGMSAERLEEWVAFAGRGAGARRFLPSGVRARADVVAAFSSVLQAAVSGSPVAERLSTVLPLLLLPRGEGVPAMVLKCLSTGGGPRDLSPCCGSGGVWRLAGGGSSRALRVLHAAAAAGDARRIARVLGTWGEEPAALSLAEAEAVVRPLFPPASMTIPDPGESTAWDAVVHGAAVSEGARVVIGRADVVDWCRRHSARGADCMGWTPELVLGLLREPSCSVPLVTLMSRRPGEWKDRTASVMLYRTFSGALIPRAGKGPRPISAATVFRCVRAAVLCRRARGLLAVVSEAAGQVGLSARPVRSAFVGFASLAAKAGATVVARDLKASYQMFGRSPMLRGAQRVLESPEARGMPGAARAFADVVSEFVLDSGAEPLPRPVTRYAAYPTLVPPLSHSLFQGCPVSTPLETTTLAAAAAVCGLADGRGVVRRGCHDDAWTVCFGAGVDADGVVGGVLRLPVLDTGSVWAEDKCRAVGPLADVAVGVGGAASATDLVVLFGIPVGGSVEVAAWAACVWLPRFRRMVAALTAVWDADPEAAVASALASGGPAGWARHWMSYVDPSDPCVRGVVGEADTAWVDMWMRFAGRLDPDPSLRPAVADVLFAAAPAGLGMGSAADACASCYSGQMALMWPVVVRWARGGEIDWRVFARVAGRGAGVVDGCVDAEAFGALLVAAAGAGAAEHARALGARSARLGVLHAGRNRGGMPSLLLMGLMPSRTDLRPLADDRAGVCFIVARALGVPVWPRRGLPFSPPPPVCPWCFAPRGAISSRVGGGVGAVLDDHGEHLLGGCRAAPGKALFRHNAFCREAVEIDRMCGGVSALHDGPVFDDGSKRRPADWMESSARYPAGLCWDFTCGVLRVAGAVARERMKHEKFDGQVAAHNGLGFRAFATDLDGGMGDEAWALVGEWVRRYAVILARQGERVVSAKQEVLARVGRAFCRAYANQVCMGGEVRWRGWRVGGVVRNGPRAVRSG